MTLDRLLMRLVALGVAALAIGIGAAAVTGQTAPPKGDPAAGKKIFAVKCAPCHKADGSGGIKLTGNPTPNWRDPKRMADPKHDDDYLRDCMVRGKVKSGMQPVAKLGVKPEEIEHLIAHIRTLAAAKK
jgi:mono/diheme cytochrome c family protein